MKFKNKYNIIINEIYLKLLFKLIIFDKKIILLFFFLIKIYLKYNYLNICFYIIILFSFGAFG